MRLMHGTRTSRHDGDQLRYSHAGIGRSAVATHLRRFRCLERVLGTAIRSYRRTERFSESSRVLVTAWTVIFLTGSYRDVPRETPLLRRVSTFPIRRETVTDHKKKGDFHKNGKDDKGGNKKQDNSDSTASKDNNQNAGHGGHK
jgi:hypothetical protein